MNIVVTGGAGFIGQRLCLALGAAGYEVRALTLQPPDLQTVIENVHWVQGDLTKAAELARLVQGAEVLLHCAGEIADESRMHLLHVEGTQNLIAVATGLISRWIQLSSTGVYGTHRSGQVSESSPLAPLGVYECTKAASDDLVTKAAINGAFTLTILRPSIVFGKGMPNQSLFAMLRMIERGLFCYVGCPGASANYLHVDNVVSALLLCGFQEQAAGETFNLSDHVTVEQFVHLMALQLNVPEPKLRLPESPTRWLAALAQCVPRFPLSVSRVDALTSFVTYPTTKIEQLMSYHHKVSMLEGIADLVSDYRQRKL